MSRREQSYISPCTGARRLARTADEMVKDAAALEAQAYRRSSGRRPGQGRNAGPNLDAAARDLAKARKLQVRAAEIYERVLSIARVHRCGPQPKKPWELSGARRVRRRTR